MIKNLTGEHLNSLPSFFMERWRPIPYLIGAPTNPDAALAAVQSLCRRVRRFIPKQATWVLTPPKRGGLGLGHAMQCNGTRPCAQCVVSRLWTKYDELIPDSMRKQFSVSFGARVDRAAAEWLRVHYGGTKIDAIFAVAANGRHPVEFDFLDQIGRQRFEFVRALRMIALQCSAWWFDGDRVVFAQLPNRIHRNEQGQLSAAEGPAVSYADGTKYFAWRGQPIREVVQPAIIRRQYDRNSFPVAIMSSILPFREATLAIEMYGTEKFLDELPPRMKYLLDESKWGKLWEVRSDDRREVRVFVEVENSSGRHEHHVIPVDPWCRPLTPHGIKRGSAERTALAGIASTFGMLPAEYINIVQA